MKIHITTQLTVCDKINTIELPTNLKHNFKNVGNDVFIAWYTTEENELDKKGVYLDLYNNQSLDDKPEHIIVDATFYFKDNNGNIIIRQFENGPLDIMSHSLIEGYTPYKVVASYRKITSQEKVLIDSGYVYDAKKDEWYDLYARHTKVLNVSIYENRYEDGNTIFRTYYQTEDGQEIKGVHFEAVNKFDPLDGIPEYKLTDVEFMFKNSSGNRIVEGATEISTDKYYHSLIPGYTPYSVYFEYRHRSDEDYAYYN